PHQRATAGLLARARERRVVRAVGRVERREPDPCSIHESRGNARTPLGRRSSTHSGSATVRTVFLHAHAKSARGLLAWFAMTARRYLMVSPLFPPSSFVGAKRALHFARNTPKFGWEAAVVCLPPGSDRDPALEPLVPDVPVLPALRQGVVARLEDRFSSAGAKGRHYRSAPEQKGRRFGELKQQLRRFLQFPLEKSAAYIASALSDCVYLMRRQDCEVIYVNASPFSALVLGTLIHQRTGAPLVLDLRDPWSIE